MLKWWIVILQDYAQWNNMFDGLRDTFCLEINA